MKDTISVFELLKEMDLRYQQRYDAQNKALDAALLAAEKAVQCVTADTPVLDADLVWRPAGELVPGDELIAFDADAPAGRSRGRLFRKAVVTGNTLREDSLVNVVTPVGSVRCNLTHPWLVRRPHDHTWRWVIAADLKPGDEVNYVVDVWDVEQTWEAGWLAGMFDGEGWLYFDKNDKARLGVVQRVSDTADRLHAVLKSRLQTFGLQRREFSDRQPQMSFSINMRADVMKILGSIRPSRLMPHARRVWEGKPIGGKNRATVVVSVSLAGVGTVASLSTSTGTYIAGGFAMHNTALIAAEKAVTKAETAAEKRFDSVNEFRAAYQDLISHQMPRAEAEQQLHQVDEKIHRNEVAITHLETQLASQKSRAAAYASALTIAMVIVTAILLVVRFAFDAP
jgi:hypothetical protein